MPLEYKIYRGAENERRVYSNASDATDRERKSSRLGNFMPSRSPVGTRNTSGFCSKFATIFLILGPTKR